MDWAPKSLDVNIIEAVWNHLERERGKKRQPTSKKEL